MHRRIWSTWVALAAATHGLVIRHICRGNRMDPTKSPAFPSARDEGRSLQSCLIGCLGRLALAYLILMAAAFVIGLLMFFFFAFQRAVA